MNTSYDDIYLSAVKKLNAEQLDAVESIEGPVAVVAGPGTGKTQILALRIGNILRRTQVDPRNILALTFTEIGVIAMKNRLLELIGPTAHDVQIYTFHGFCNKIIEEFPEKFVFKKELKLIDEITQVELIREIFDRLSLQYLSNPKNKYYNVQSTLKAISSLKSESISMAKLQDYLKEKMIELSSQMDVLKPTAYNKLHVKILKLEELAVVFSEYATKMKELGYYDFNDLIIQVLKRLKKDSDLLLNYQETFQYVLSDEFQDSNNAQTEILDLLVSFHTDSPDLFVVGDDDQSIYKFQGASLENFRAFFTKYPTAKKIVLKQNYRSTQLILDASKSLIENNKYRLEPEKSLVANKVDPKSEILVGKFSTELEEYTFIAKKVKSLIESGVKPSEIAILTRGNREIEKIAEYFSKFEINYYLSAKKNSLENSYILKIVSLLKVLNDPANFFEFVKFLFLPALKVEPIEILNFNRFVRTNGLKNIFACDNLDSGFPTILALVEKLKIWFMQINSDPFPVVLEIILVEIGLIDYLAETLEKVEDFEAINVFISYAKSVYLREKDQDLSHFLSSLDSMFEHKLSLKSKDIVSNENSVKLLTAHKSKGLEFEYVFIPKCTIQVWNKAGRNTNLLPDDIIPRTYSNDLEEEEESRRLFFVAATRAKSTLFFTYATNYEESSKEAMLSKFALEIDDKFKTFYNAEPLTLKELAATMVLKAPVKFIKVREVSKFKEIVSNYKLSVSAINQYLRCKKTFFMEYILCIPRQTEIRMVQGSLAHKLLEVGLANKNFTSAFMTEVATKFFEKYVLTEKELNFLLVDTLEMVGKWSEHNIAKATLPKPLFSEYEFDKRQIYLENVPIVGKIDMIELLNVEHKEVRVVDFKIGVPVGPGDILGTTKKDRTDLYRQIMFYKILADADVNFKYKVVQGAVNFLTPSNSGAYVNRCIEFNEVDLNKFKTQIIEVYNSIQNLEFLNLDDECKCDPCKYNFL